MAITNIIKENYRERRTKRKHKDAFRNIKIRVTIDEWKKIRALAKAEPEKQLTVCDTVEIDTAFFNISYLVVEKRK
ncbi:hypothetical protein [Ectobacillus funiculus]|uniref:Phage protein n=1 Tax=Ectobacillus funiculus TaxID=137993 RepID=A0ABV5WFW9_9BACI